MLTRLKKTFESLIKSEAEIAHRLHLKPNHISLIGFSLGILAGISYWFAGASRLNPSLYAASLLLAAGFLLLSGFCDALDGALARLYGEESVTGGFLDSLLDRYVEASLISGIILGGLCDVLWGLLALVGSMLTSYTRARSEAAGLPMEKIGIFERAERLLAILAGTFIGIGFPEALNYVIIGLAFLTNLTVLQRLHYFFRSAKRRGQTIRMKVEV
ncbi:MAG: CDP-alcohol phosphatidyltransferase family protein [Nitrososphaerota archaeon]|nr:CDP-alcohol phosphatidyltransferase family protein [Candidatus Bathyarchaeota archaeon]MDW8049001.1 CDP-alcohol phosphatidyltransferase family protein [Nitrososphaerota archaeon]